MDKAERAKLCRNCYFCEQGVDKAISVDDRPTLSPEEKAKLCQNCYTCQQGVDKSVTADTIRSTGLGSQAIESFTVEERAKLCRNCYTCQQGVDKSVTADTMRKKGGESAPFTWFVFPTNTCNLACKYCYASNRPGKMTKDTAEKVLDWLVNKQPNNQISVHFFGGEPTVNWDILQFVVEVGNQMVKDKPERKIGWSMTTNGTLLFPDRLDWIQTSFKENPFLLSLDGREQTHDKYRVHPNGSGSFKEIPVNDILRRWPNIECRPTIEPDTAKDWLEDYRWLRNTGFKNIAIEPDYEAEWTPEQLYDYENLLLQLGKYYVYAKLANRPIYMKWIDGIKSGLKTGQPPAGSMCGIAYNCAAIDHEGYIYPCQRYASYSDPEKYAIGDVVNGWDELKLLETRRLLRSEVCGDILSGNNCAKCEVRLFCHKGCNAANLKLMGSREIALPYYCILTRIDVRVALAVLAELGELTLRETGGRGQACGC